MPTWTEQLATGFPTIDRQHWELFSRSDALLAAMRGSEPAAHVKSLVLFLQDYVLRHFSAEEALMRDCGYPDTAAHEAEHSWFVTEFQKIADEFKTKGPTPGMTIALQQLLVDWLVRHTSTTDKKLATFILEKQRPKGPAVSSSPLPARRH